MNIFKLLIAVIAISVILSSCSKGGSTDVEYLAVKLSDSKTNWSIIELNSGKVIAREDFKNKPSVIVNDMFYVQNDKGEYEFYNINDINKQIGDSYEHATHFQNERAIVSKKDEPLQVINTKGETVKKLGESVKAAQPFKNGFATIVNEEGKAGFIDTEGNIVIKMEYDLAADFSEDGYVVVGKKNEDNMTFSVINAKGEKKFSFNSDKYSDVLTGFVGGSMAVVKDDKIVYLDSEGKQMMKVGEKKGSNDDYGIYNGLTIFANDEGNFGVKNKDGEVVIKAKYEALKPNRDGSFLATKDGKCAVVDGEGLQISADEYKDIIRINPDRFIVKDGNSYSIIDKEGKEIGTETFSDYSYKFDDSPALSDAREVNFSTDSEITHLDAAGPDSTQLSVAYGPYELPYFSDPNTTYAQDLFNSLLTGQFVNIYPGITGNEFSSIAYLDKCSAANQLRVDNSDGIRYQFFFMGSNKNSGPLTGVAVSCEGSGQCGEFESYITQSGLFTTVGNHLYETPQGCYISPGYSGNRFYIYYYLPNAPEKNPAPRK